MTTFQFTRKQLLTELKARFAHQIKYIDSLRREQGIEDETHRLLTLSYPLTFIEPHNVIAMLLDRECDVVPWDETIATFTLPEIKNPARSDDLQDHLSLSREIRSVEQGMPRMLVYVVCYMEYCGDGETRAFDVLHEQLFIGEEQATKCYNMRKLSSEPWRPFQVEDEFFMSESRKVQEYSRRRWKR